jgi:hypothetical protein
LLLLDVPIIPPREFFEHSIVTLGRKQAMNE